MFKLNYSVGVLSKSRGTVWNLNADVRVIQHLLNEKLSSEKIKSNRFSIPLIVDGFFGKKTEAAIDYFQIEKVKLFHHDSVVSPSGPTFKKLIASVPEKRLLEIWNDAMAHSVAQDSNHAKQIATQANRAKQQVRIAGSSTLGHTPKHVTVFISAHKETAQKVAKKYDIPASVILAQSAIESQWGAKAPGNAYFGIKGKSSSGATVNVATHEDTTQGHIAIHDNFRAYADYDEAAEDYGQVITTSKHFAAALLYRKEPSKFIDEVAKKYATDPHYALKVKNVIKTNNLDQYDKQ